MVAPQHEGLIGITTLDFAHTAHMLRTLFDLPIPRSGEAKLASPDLSECVPAAYRADAALLYGSGRGKLGVIAEVQRGEDDRKHKTWLLYIASLRAREQCPVCLVVICPDRRTAVWAAQPIETGHPGLTLTPLVIGPDNTPVITDVAQAVGNIGLAAVSAITHSGDPNINAILATLTEALASIDPKVAERYADFVTVALPDPAQKEMSRLMATETYLYQSEYARSLMAKGEAESVLKLLSMRGIPVSDDARERVLSCGDVATLDAWLQRAIVVESAEELFA